MGNFLNNLQEMTWLGSSLEAWFMLGVAWVAIAIALVFAHRILLRRFRRLAARTETIIDDVFATLLERTKLYFLVALSLYIAVGAVPLSEQVTSYISHIAFVFLLVQVVFWGNAAISDWVRLYKERKLEEDAGAVTSMQAIGFLARLLLYTALLLVALDNFGIDVTALIAGLGIGGIAVALAMQNILGDLFGSLTIVLDKPFEVGDFLIVGDTLGTVEKVGLKTTRLRSLSGEQIVIANGDLLGSRIRNYKRMQERRILFSLGVAYDTPADKLERIPDMVQEIVEVQEHTRFDRAHFTRFGDSTLDFEVVYYMRTPDYRTFMDIQQTINLALFRRFEEEGIQFAFPTRTVHVKQEQETPAL